MRCLRRRALGTGRGAERALQRVPVLLESAVSSACSFLAPREGSEGPRWSWRDCSGPGGLCGAGCSTGGCQPGSVSSSFCNLLHWTPVEGSLGRGWGQSPPPPKASGVGWEEVPSGLLKFKKGLWKRDLIVHV